MIDIELIRSLVGPITEEQLQFVDCYTGKKVGLFIPAVGQCGYAVTEEHTHPGFSFVISFDNRLRVGSGSGAHAEEFGKGILIAMSPDFPHHEEESEEFSRYYALMIEKEYFNSVLTQYNKPTNPHFAFDTFPVSGDIMSQLRSFMLETEPPKNRQNPEMVDALECIITHSVVRELYPGQNRNSDSVSHRFEVDKTLEILNARFGEKLTVEDIATEVCLSPSHLSRLFKEATGKTLMGYLNEIRLSNAKRLVLTSADSISEIAFSCGYSSPSHLSQSFKSAYGITPREMKKHNPTSA